MIVKIDNLAHDGRGITRVSGKVTFVKNALPNEIIDIKIIKEKKNYNEAETIKIIEPSKDRIKSLCPCYNECGGCEIMHMTYISQLNFKKDKVKNILKKYTGIELNPSIIASDKEFNYRNKITLHNKNNRLGYMKQNTNEIVKIDSCPIAMESINKYLKEIKDIKTENFVIRTNEQGNIISSNKDKDLIIEINNFKFYIDINSFFQINNYICSKIFENLENNLEENNVCLDLYSGVGTLSIIASKKMNTVYSIEVNNNSYKNAIKNIKLNNIDNIKLMHGKVEDKIKEINEKVDVIITDPPRNGMDNHTISTIRKLNPTRIIYISCNPITLARDLNKLKDTYELKEITLFDMFPNTSHVESMCVLNRL